MEKHPSPRRLGRELPIEKAARYLLEDRVQLVPSAIVYEVAGDTGTYRVIADEHGITCPCPARTPLCAHVLATAHARAIDTAAVLGDAA